MMEIKSTLDIILKRLMKSHVLIFNGSKKRIASVLLLRALCTLFNSITKFVWALRGLWWPDTQY